MPMKKVFLERDAPVLEEDIDTLETQLRTKMDLKTGFAEPHALARAMHSLLRSFNQGDNGTLELQHFRKVMTMLNCGDNSSTVDALFFRHDLAGKGIIVVKDFCDGLFGIKVVPKSNKACRDVIKIVREKLLSRGDGGFRGFVRTLRILDDNGNRVLDRSEVLSGLQTLGIHLDKDEVSTLFKFFDKDGNGGIDVTEFIVGLRPTMSASRLALVRLAFLRLDRNEDGTVRLDDLKAIYQVSKHPAVVSGEKTESQVLKEFSAAWNLNGDDEVTEEEFTNYYRDISASIDHDEYFELMIRNAWRISGGTGSSANTSNLRVLVTLLDGTQSVETIDNDLGVTRDEKGIIAALRKQGVTDILSVELR